jgi:hypothetical protein
MNEGFEKFNICVLRCCLVHFYALLTPKIFINILFAAWMKIWKMKLVEVLCLQNSLEKVLVWASLKNKYVVNIATLA